MILPDGIQQSATLPQDMMNSLQVENNTAAIRRHTKHTHLFGTDTVEMYIDNASEPLTIQLVRQAVFGRYTPGSMSQPRIDLEPYRAYSKGVSRMHAAIRRLDSGLVIEDLQSSNGTWVNMVRLQPYHPCPLHSGDIVNLGKLEIQIFFGEQGG